jgi:hypothetical protein
MNILRAQSLQQQQQRAEAAAGRARRQAPRTVRTISDAEVARVCDYHAAQVHAAIGRGDAWSASHHAVCAMQMLHRQRAASYQAQRRCTWAKAWQATKESEVL